MLAQCLAENKNSRMLALIASFNPQRASSWTVASGHRKARGSFRGPAAISLCGSLSVSVSLWRRRWAANVHCVNRTEAGPGSLQHRTGHPAEAIQVTPCRYMWDTPSPQDTVNSPSPFPTPAPLHLNSGPVPPCASQEVVPL